MEHINDVYARYDGENHDLAISITARELGLEECCVREVIDSGQTRNIQGPYPRVPATHIRFSATTQQWEVINASSNERMFSHASRKQCLQWEHDNLQPHTSTI